jgi:ketosteroid isomerase-like protein
MYQRCFRTIAFVLLAFSCAVSAHAAESGAKLVDSSWAKAMKANDLEAVMKTYAPNAVAWLPGGPEARGEQAIRSAYQNLLSSNTVTEVVLSETGYKTMGKTSVGWGKFSLTLVPKAGGDAVVMKGRYTDIAERQGGRWVYIVDHASADPAGAEGAKK